MVCENDSNYRHLRKFRKLSIFIPVILLALSLAVTAAAQNDKQGIDLSGFSGEVTANGLPAHWQRLNFTTIATKTRYDMVDDESYGTVIHASSSGGAGAIARTLSVDPRKYPVLNWHWKIEQTLPGSSLHHKSGDDFPVRLLVSFSSGSAGQPGTQKKSAQDKTLCYVWATDDPVNSFAVNPHLGQVMTIVAANGSSQAGSWLELSRNIFDDYITVFSEEPEMITGVALMSDGDDTGSQVQAWYGPVWLRSLAAGQ